MPKPRFNREDALSFQMQPSPGKWEVQPTVPEESHAVRPDAIVPTGRSDYPNEVNNVLGLPTFSAAPSTSMPAPSTTR